uniref:GT23 domain-containing protein n=1 Tax=Ciona savignyi TaxID=51511 RepID=H2YUI6_CIOSA
LHVQNKQYFARYPNYQFICGESASAGLKSRFTKNGLFGIVKDIFLLRECDYLVLTMSSNVRRLIQEMRETSSHDATFLSANLDYSYHATRGRDIVHEVLYDHIPLTPCELPSNMDKEAQRHTDGTCGLNKRTKRVGMYPAFKVKPVLMPVSYPISVVQND